MTQRSDQQGDLNTILFERVAALDALPFNPQTISGERTFIKPINALRGIVIGFRPNNAYFFDTSANIFSDASDFVFVGPSGDVMWSYNTNNNRFEFNRAVDFGNNRVSTSYYPDFCDDHAFATVEYVNNNKFDFADCSDASLVDAIFREVVSANANQTISGQKLFTQYTLFDGGLRATNIDMSGILNMHGYRIVNLGDPIDASDAANREYVDQRFNSIFSGDVSFTGIKQFLGPVIVSDLQLAINQPLSLANQRISQLSPPILATDAANRQYVDAAVNQPIINGARTFTGQVTLQNAVITAGQNINMNSRRIIGLSPPEGAGDAVNLQTLQNQIALLSNTITLGSNILSNSTLNSPILSNAIIYADLLDARSNYIFNVRTPDSNVNIS
jgi:hypothetical protein